MINNVAIRLSELLEIIPSQLSEISEEDFSMKVDSTKWSKKEILGHLIDSVTNNHHRFIRVQYEHIPTIFYDQNRWNELNHYQQLESQHLILLWKVYNKQILEIINRLPEKSLTLECHVGNEKIVTLKYIIEDYVEHLEHHLKQIVSYNL